MEKNSRKISTQALHCTALHRQKSKCRAVNSQSRFCRSSISIFKSSDYQAIALLPRFFFPYAEPSHPFPRCQLHHTLSSDDDDDGMIFHFHFVYVLTLNRKPAPSAIPSDDEIVMWGHDDLISCRAVRPSLASGASSL